MSGLEIKNPIKPFYIPFSLEPLEKAPSSLLEASHNVYYILAILEAFALQILVVDVVKTLKSSS